MIPSRRGDAENLLGLFQQAEVSGAQVPSVHAEYRRREPDARTPHELFIPRRVGHVEAVWTVAERPGCSPTGGLRRAFRPDSEGSREGKHGGREACCFIAEGVNSP